MIQTKNLVLFFSDSEIEKINFIRKLIIEELVEFIHINSESLSVFARCVKDEEIYDFVNVNIYMTKVVPEELLKHYSAVSIFFIFSERKLSIREFKKFQRSVNLFPKKAVEKFIFGLSDPELLYLLEDFNSYNYKIKFDLKNTENFYFSNNEISDLFDIIRKNKVNVKDLVDFNFLKEDISSIQQFLKYLNTSILKSLAFLTLFKDLIFSYGALIHIFSNEEIGLESVEHERFLLDNYDMAVRIHNGSFEEVVRKIRFTLKSIRSELKKVGTTCYHYSEEERSFASTTIEKLKSLKLKI